MATYWHNGRTRRKRKPKPKVEFCPMECRCAKCCPFVNGDVPLLSKPFEPFLCKGTKQPDFG